MQSRADFARCEAEATAKIDAVRASLGVWFVISRDARLVRPQ
jgi:hypothetical protein